MTEITAALVKKLREETAAGMMDCKKALVETDGDHKAAIDWLRTKGLSAAAKKAGRITSEGLVGVSIDGATGALVEVNAETDFVARNVEFQEFVKTTAGLALESGGDLDTLKAAVYPGTERTVEEQLTHLITTIGENMSLRRVQDRGQSRDYRILCTQFPIPQAGQDRGVDGAGIGNRCDNARRPRQADFHACGGGQALGRFPRRLGPGGGQT